MDGNEHTSLYPHTHARHHVVERLYHILDFMECRRSEPRSHGSTQIFIHGNKNRNNRLFISVWFLKMGNLGFMLSI